MRAHVINLASRSDRRAQFLRWNERPGLDIIFVDAVVGASIDREALVRDGLLASKTEPFSAGALGNALSHHALWRRAEEAPDPLFVCEDDACLRGDFVEKAEALLGQLSGAWDILFLGYNTNAVVATQSAEGLKTLLFVDESAKRTPGFFDGYARQSAAPPTALACFQAWGTLCYLISPAGAAKLLRACFPLSAAPDLVMFGQNRSIKPYTLDGMLNVALQREPIAAYCAFPPLALSSNDAAGSDVV